MAGSRIGTDLRASFKSANISRRFARRIERQTAQLQRPMLNAGSAFHLHPLLASGASRGIYFDRFDYSSSIPEEIERHGGKVLSEEGTAPRIITFSLWRQERTIYFYEADALEYGKSFNPAEAASGVSFYYTAFRGGPPPTGKAIRSVVQGGFVMTRAIFDADLTLSLLGLRRILTEDESEVLAKSLYKKVGEIADYDELPFYGDLPNLLQHLASFQEYWQSLVNLDVAYFQECYSAYFSPEHVATKQGMIDILNYAIDKYFGFGIEQTCQYISHDIFSLPEGIQRKILSWMESNVYNCAADPAKDIDKDISNQVRDYLREVYVQYFG